MSQLCPSSETGSYGNNNEARCNHLSRGGPIARNERSSRRYMWDLFASYEQLSFLPNVTRPLSVMPK
jgi:hypothetical protein